MTEGRGSLPRLVAWGALGLGLLLLLARAFLVDLRVLAGDSMSPGLQRGDLVLLWRLGSPRPGDVVLHRIGDDPQRYLKRVVAVGGETVEQVGGALLVDGELLATGEEQSVRYRWNCEPSEALARVEARGEQHWLVIPGRDDQPAQVVPPQHLWVLGDHRGRSRDSRVWGPIAQDEVEGVVLLHLPLNARCPRAAPSALK